MAVINRSLGNDTQKKAINFAFAADIAFGHSGLLTIIPFPCSLDLITYTAAGGSTVGLQKVAGCFVVQPVQDAISYLNALA